MKSYSPVWPHSAISEIFSDIFFVTGQNITHHEEVDFQHSRNMIIVRDDQRLSLINTVRLNEQGLAALDALGQVENVIRIGAFHGRDDTFYLDRYQAKLWALSEMKHDIALIPGGEMPFPRCSMFTFETSVHAEGILHLDKEGGILITCDSIKNWLGPDEFFSQESAKLYEQQGFFGTASISNVWLDACKVELSDFTRLQRLHYNHLLSAHGVPLLKNAYELVNKSIEQRFKFT